MAPSGPAVAACVLGTAVSALACAVQPLESEARCTVPAHYSSQGEPPPPFGHETLRLFGLDAGYTNLNHGSYGALPLAVSGALRRYEARMEANPDRWFRREVYGRMDAVRAQLASYLGADPEDVVFVPNASHGINAVLRSRDLGKLLSRGGRGSRVLFLSTAYKMVRNALKYEMANRVTMTEVEIEWPATHGDILRSVDAEITRTNGALPVRLCIFSHIVSVPSALLPIKSLTKLCHRHGALVLIDGAHALGQVPVNLTDIGADFWVGNGHKWLYSPKGSAVLWVRRDRQALVEPTTISWLGRGVSHFQKSFSYTGTSSYSAYLAMADALEFRRWLGGDRAISDYTHHLAMRAGARLAEMFGTDVLFEDDRMYVAMVDVLLPVDVADAVAKALPFALLDGHDTYVPTHRLRVAGKGFRWFIRVSCQIYMEMSDVEELGWSVLDVLAKASASK